MRCALSAAFMAKTQKPVQSAWLQLQLSSDPSLEMSSDAGPGNASKKANSGMQRSSAIDDDLSDILRGYIQKHEMSSGTDSQEDDHDSSVNDYQPGSSEECGPSWTRFSLAEDLVAPEFQDEIKASGE